MFEIRLYCEDSKLQKVMWALDGIIVGMPQVTPVRGAKASSNGKKVVAVNKDGKSIIAKMTEEILGLGLLEVTTKQLQDIGVKSGSKRKESTSSLITSLQKEGLLQRIEKGRYQVIDR